MIILNLLCIKCSSFMNIPRNWHGEIQISYCGNPPIVFRHGLAYPLPNCSNPQKNTTVLCVEDPSLAFKTPFQIPFTYNPIKFTSLPLINFVHTDGCYKQNNTKECTIDSKNAVPQFKQSKLFYQANLPLLSSQSFFHKLDKIILKNMLKFSNGILLFSPKEILTVVVTEFEGNHILILGYVLFYNFFLNGFINFDLRNTNNTFNDKSNTFGVKALIEETKEWVEEDVLFCNIDEGINKLTSLATKKISTNDICGFSSSIERFREYLIENFDFLFRI